MLIPPVGLRPISAMDQAPQILLRCKGGFYRKNEEMLEAEKSPNNLQNAKSSKNIGKTQLDSIWMLFGIVTYSMFCLVEEKAMPFFLPGR